MTEEKNPQGFQKGHKHGYRTGEAKTKYNLRRNETLTDKTALALYKMTWENTGLTNREVGNIFGVSAEHVTSIKHGHSWQHITGHVRKPKK